MMMGMVSVCVFIFAGKGWGKGAGWGKRVGKCEILGRVKLCVCVCVCVCARGGVNIGSGGEGCVCVTRAPSADVRATAVVHPRLPEHLETDLRTWGGQVCAVGVMVR